MVVSCLNNEALRCRARVVPETIAVHKGHLGKKVPKAEVRSTSALGLQRLQLYPNEALPSIVRRLLFKEGALCRVYGCKHLAKEKSPKGRNKAEVRSTPGLGGPNRWDAPELVQSKFLWRFFSVAG